MLVSVVQRGGRRYSALEVLRFFGNTFSYNKSMSKIMISLPEELLQELDLEAQRRSMSRSALIAVAARRELARRDPDVVAEAITRSKSRFLQAGRFESADLVREIRDSRR